MRYISSLGHTVNFVPESIVKDFEFRYGEPVTVKEYPAASIQDPFLVDTSLPPTITIVIRTIEVKAVNFLNEGEVLFRNWSNPDYPDSIRRVHNIDDRFKIVPVAKVLELVLASGASGPIDELKALLPSKLPNRPPSYSSYDPNHAVSTDGKPLEQIDLEKGEPENGESPNGPIRPNGRSKPGEFEKLTELYVRWAEALPDDELMRIFGSQKGVFTKEAIEEFPKYLRAKKIKITWNDRSPRRIRKILDQDSSLRLRLDNVQAKAREMKRP